MKAKTWIKEIENHMKAVEKERDAIEDPMSEMIALKDSCDRAYDALQDARDALSEMV